MKKGIRVLCLVLALLLFSAFAIGSGSTDATEKTDSDTTAAGDVTVAADTAEYELGDGIVRVWTNSIDTKWIMVAVPVKNTGTTDLYLSTGTIDVEDASGTLVQSISMVSVYPQVLQPGETAYYYEETLFDGGSEDGLTVVPHVDVEKATVDCIRYELSEIQVKDQEYNSAHVVGRVENTTDTAESMAYVVANLYDTDGNFLAQEFTILDNELGAGEKMGFETGSTAYEFNADEVGSYEVYVFPYQYQF